MGDGSLFQKKKEDKSKKEERRLEQEKTEQLYNDYLNQF